MTTTEAKAPKRIYLEPEWSEHGERDWCEDRIGPDWIEYVRADLIASLEAENERLRKAARDLIGSLEDPFTLVGPAAERAAEKLRQALDSE